MTTCILRGARRVIMNFFQTPEPRAMIVQHSLLGLWRVRWVTILQRLTASSTIFGASIDRANRGYMLS
jgi:hypothetical protein